MEDTIYILDGYGLIYRAYFAFIHRPLTDKDGANISAVHGFFRVLYSLKKQYGASRIAVALDPAGPTFRHERYSEYKANRDPAPEDLHAQVPVIQSLLELLAVPVLRLDGFEADDVMGTVAVQCEKQGLRCRLVSADKDLMQLVTDSVHQLLPEKGRGFRELDPQGVFEEKGITPAQMIDYLALIGDASDNIPGVAGIGPKTACCLLAEWKTLDRLFENLDSAVKGARLKKLTEGRDNAFFSREMVTIRTDVEIGTDMEFIGTGTPDYAAAAAFLRSRGIRTLADETEAFGSHKASGELFDAAPAEVSASAVETHYGAILTQGDLELWSGKIRNAGLVALDTETDSLDPMRANLVGLSVAVAEGEAAYLPVACPDTECLAPAAVVDWLNNLLTDSSVRVIGQNFKYDMKVLRRAGVSIGAAWFDTMIAAWIIDASSSVGMDALALRYLGIKTIKFKDVVPKGKTFGDVPLQQAVEYAAEDADITLRLFHLLQPLLREDEKREALFKNMEMPLQGILAGMEQEGIGLDIFALEAYGEELGGAVKEMENEIYELCGREFNIASPKQLQQILFEERGLEPGKKTKTGYSTDNSVLTELAREDPVPEKILVYRSLTKLKSTYVDVLPQLVHPVDGRIHTSYSQVGAATGRLSSTDPNLQNIPIRDENGRRIRSAFKSKPGHLFVSADYSQIELVVLAHMSEDTALAEAFRQGVDVHARTAALIFGVDPADVTSRQRRMAKAVNFGVMYGMSAFRLSNELGIPRKEAKHFIEAYFTTYSKIKTFVEDAAAEAEREGGIRTLYGRFRPLPGINSRNRVEKAAAERAAVNSRIQGTAADIMKKAMIAVDESLETRCPGARMLLQVHDELLVEVPESGAQAAGDFLKNAMESVVELSVPLRATPEIGACWGDLH